MGTGTITRRAAPRGRRLGRATALVALVGILVLPSTASATDIAAGPDGNLWFITPTAHAVGRVTPAGVVSWIPVGGASQDPFSLTAGPDGAVWFTEYAPATTIGRIGPDGSVTRLASGERRGTMLGPIISGGDGNLWFVASRGPGSAIVRMTPSGSVTPFPVDAPTITALAWGPDGNVWFTDIRHDRVARLTPEGAVTPVSARITGPSAITTGPDGNLWASDGTGIARITPAGVVTRHRLGPDSQESVRALAAGPDGNLWFVTIGDRYGRMTPAGRARLFDSPSLRQGLGPPEAIAAGPDGNMWMAAQGRIRRVAMSGALTDVPPVPEITALRQVGTRAVRARLRCPARALAACRGRAVFEIVRFPPGRPFRVHVARFAVAPGQRVDLVAPLPARWRRALRRGSHLGAFVRVSPRPMAGSAEIPGDLVMRSTVLAPPRGE